MTMLITKVALETPWGVLNVPLWEPTEDLWIAEEQAKTIVQREAPGFKLNATWMREAE